MGNMFRCAFCTHSDFYENSAVMVEEEGAVIVGLLVGLNVIDANLCVKGEDLDTQVSQPPHFSHCSKFPMTAF